MYRCTLEINPVISRKGKHATTTLQCSNPTLSYLFTRCENTGKQRDLCKNVCSKSIHISQNTRKLPKCPSTEKMDK